MSGTRIAMQAAPSRSRVRKAFSRAAETYANAATVQAQVGNSLFARLPELPDLPGVEHIADVGSGVGHARHSLQGKYPHATLIDLDFSEPMLRKSVSALRLCGDAGALPLATGSIDLLWSNLTWQWCALPTVLAEARRVLRDEGALAFSTLVEPSFGELRAAFSELDDSSHTLDFLSADAVIESVRAAGFRDIATGREKIVAHYPSLKHLLRAIRDVGASEISGPRRRGLLGRDGWRRVEAAYARSAEARGLPLVYDVLYLSARK